MPFQQVTELVSGLKSRSADTRRRYVRELYHYAKTELREMPQDVLTQVLDEFNLHIHTMILSYDTNEKKAGILTIVCLIEGDTETTKTRTTSYANHLRNVFPSSEVSVLELAAKTMGRLAASLGVKRGEYIEFEIKRALEWLREDRHEGKRLSAVLILKEFAMAMPTYFFQQINSFFNHIMLPFRDSKAHIREAAAKALRAAFVVTAQRELSNQSHKAHWYIQCYEEAMKSFSDASIRERHLTRDDHVHGALIMFNELLRISNSAWEKKYTNLMQKLDTEQENTDEITSINAKVSHSSGSRLSNENATSQSITFHESNVCRQLIIEKYEKICSDVMAQQISRSHHVHQMLLIMIPRLAAFNCEVFTRKHLKSTINHLITFLRSRDKDKVIAFTTLGLIAVAVEADIKPYLSRIIDIIKVTMPGREVVSKKRNISDPAVFICVTLLAYSVKEDVADEVKELLDPMCAMGLSSLLTICFKELSIYIPSLHKVITDRLLNMLSMILRKKPFHPSSVPINIEQQMLHMTLLIEPHDANKLVMALHTLGAFGFDWHNGLLSFIRRCTNHYLQSEHQDIRLEAVRTTSKLLLKAVERASVSHSNTLLNIIDEAIAKLLTTAVTDFDYEVRYCVFDSLGEVFDPYLANVEHLSSLFITINDEQPEVRELAICTIGRLSTINPAYVMPTLRRVLIQLLIEIEQSGLNRSKEQATKMLDNLILFAPRMIRPYIDTVLNILVPKLREDDTCPGVIISVLKAIGDLADIAGDSNSLSKWMPDLLAIMMDLLSDSNASEKRSVALWTFGQLISATGLVVTPYMEYPNLLNILFNFLKTEQQTKDRRETIRVLGILGALDPYKHKLNRGLIGSEQALMSSLIPSNDAFNEDNFEMDIYKRAHSMTTASLDESYPAIVVPSLMRILSDPTLAQHHMHAVQAITCVFQSLGIRCVPYIPLVIPNMLQLIQTTELLTFREFLFTQLATLISIVKQHIRNYLDKIFSIIREFWSPGSELQGTLIFLVEHIAVALGSEFKVYLPKIVPQILKVLSHDKSPGRVVTEILLLTIQKFEDSLDDYLHVVVPAIVKLFESKDCPLAVSKLAMLTIDHLSIFLNFSDLSSRIVHPLVRVLDTNPALRMTAMNTLCALIIQLGCKYNDFIPGVERVIVKHGIQCVNYQVLVSKLQCDSTLASDDNYLHATRKKLRNKTRNVVQSGSDTTYVFKRLHVNVHNLRRAWAVTSRVSKDDWLEWLRRISVGLLTESHSPALRSCSLLAHNYPQLASDLFNAAFVSCWTLLDETLRNEVVVALEQALVVPDSPELTHAVLNLAEFMEHCEKGALPISVNRLGERAINCRAYAKALYYKEEEYRNNPSSEVIEALIHINNKLQQKEAANGLLEKVMSQKNDNDKQLNLHVRWYEKLHNWDQALNLYDVKLANEPEDMESRLGQMRCLEALGEWGKLNEVVSERWSTMDKELQGKTAKLAAAATWGLQQWDSMKKYVECVPEDTIDGSFYRAILAIHDNQWGESRNYVDQARTLLDSELTAVVGESYQRAYVALVNAQLLAELEEVVTFKLVSEKRNVIRQAWWMRLQGGQRVVEDWRKILQVRSLVLSPQEDLHTWLKFASLCRKSGALPQAHKVFATLVGYEPGQNPELPLPMNDPRLNLGYSKLLWVSEDKHLAYFYLQRYVDSVGRGDAEHCRLLARCHLKVGSWFESLRGINEVSINEVLRNYKTATLLAPEWYKVWHTWACMNFEALLFHKQQDNNSDNSLTGSTSDKKGSRFDNVSQYTLAAVEGFFKSINLSHGSSLQDTLRLLTLWFDYGHHQVVYEALFEGIRKIEINIWLQVIPQLIARIDTPRPLVAKLIHSLLIEIGKAHPQALVYPLTVSSKSSFPARQTAANQILNSMSSHSANLVSQAAVISEELVRVAILWHDQWYIALDEASRLYYSDKDNKGMLKTLEPMHAMIERGPQTLKEISFIQTYGRELREAQEWCNKYKESGSSRDLNQAWDLYYHVFRRISSQFRSLTSLELPYVSPRLLKCQDLELSVPGSYVPNQEIIRISFIHSNLQVIKSKQRPRRLTIQGSNGKEYMFLLKGHEDLRQDERVMQLFGLVNTLLQADPHTFRRDLAIQRYAVIPLSTNSGLIGWVPHCDTLYNLISDYRRENDKKPNRMPLNAEQQIMMRMASDLQKLMLMQKVEVFEYTLSQTPGNDLARLLWLKSPSAEAWFERRTNYTRSLAVMSMVGYILGLGDRHPSNIMLHRVTGKVLHIDFGDCFEVTLSREKFPEKIPFRLTRMLINAMEVTGIEGTYRSTCELVMDVLHKHKDSVMAVLEAFVYDPLLNWRLIDAGRRSLADTSLGSSEGHSPSTLPSRSRHRLSEAAEPQITEISLNKRALTIVNRVRDKLTGSDFPNGTLTVNTQVDLLIKQATSNENLCQCYMGWCPFW